MTAEFCSSYTYNTQDIGSKPRDHIVYVQRMRIEYVFDMMSCVPNARMLAGTEHSSSAERTKRHDNMHLVL